MRTRRFLAFDLGAESGRTVVGSLENGKLDLEEIQRFPNEPVEVNQTLYWDVLSLYKYLLKGLREYQMRFGASVDGIGIDTWGVDFGLLTKNGDLLQNPVHYRDRRTRGMIEEASSRIAPEDLFRLTGMSLLPINTLFQLLSLRICESPILKSAGTLLMMPDLLNYFLTGQRKGERTIAITSQLYDPRKHNWCQEVFQKLDLPVSIMPDLVNPGTILGELSTSITSSVGLKNGLVIAPCAHDTASAVAAVPAEGKDWAFMSSGTWFVLGALSSEIVSSAAAFSAGVFNELTLESFFLCRNIMGLWLLQQARAVWQREGHAFSYSELTALAAQASESGPLIDPDDLRFLAPTDMVKAIQQYCGETGQPLPRDPAIITRCILESLALACHHRLDQLAGMLGRSFDVLHIVGGGAKNALLCQLISNAINLPVRAGPSEATVAGNIMVQAIALDCVTSVEEIRQIVRLSSELVEYQPRDRLRWEENYRRYLDLVQPRG